MTVISIELSDEELLLVTAAVRNERESLAQLADAMGEDAPIKAVYDVSRLGFIEHRLAKAGELQAIR